jgi:curved DNA-binding protein
MAVEYKDYYKILGVTKKATPEELKKAFRTLARKYHPDRASKDDPKAVERFKEINEAYEVLKDPDKRQRYDNFGAYESGQRLQGFEDLFGGGARGGGTGFSNFFEALFGGGGGGDPLGGRRRAAPGGAGSFAQVFQNMQRQQQVRGAAGPQGFPGAQPGAAGPETGDIESDLEITVQQAYAQEKVSVEAGGRKISLRLPVGLSEGKKIRLAGQGAPGHGRMGDLTLKVRFARDPKYSMEGLTLHRKLSLTAAEALLGAQVSAEIFDKTVKLKIPAGSSSGSKLRLRGHGLPQGEDTRGDLIMEIQVEAPKDPSAEERALYQKLLDMESKPER